MREEIKVLVVGAEPTLAERLAHLLPRKGRAHVVASVVEPGEAGKRVARGEADVVLIDLGSDGNATVSIGAIRSAADTAKVLALTDDQSPDELAAVLGAGACGFISRDVQVEELLRALHRASAGELVIPERDLHRVVGRLQRATLEVSDEARLASLTVRERQILNALAEGRSTADIAGGFGISVMTVQSHVKSILAKLGVHSKVEAVTLAFRYGMGIASRTA